MQKWYFISLLCLMLGASCSTPADNPGTERAFYHWKTAFDPTEEEITLLQDLGVTRLYLKYFDVDRGPAGNLVPVAPIQFKRPWPDFLELTPCVFITNQSLKTLNGGGIHELAGNILYKIRALHATCDCPAYREVQIDCDWTPSTRQAYFTLLQELHDSLEVQGIALSATIRLYQFRYPEQAGVPPVDRGLLMSYNMGDISDPQEKNSILDPDILRSYLDGASPYPLPLDIGLPAFSWAVVYRMGRPVALLSEVSAAELAANPRLEKTGPSRTIVTESHYFHQEYLYQGDEIRLERISEDALLSAAQQLAGQFDQGPRTVSIYHLNRATVDNYAQDIYQDLYSHFD